MAAGISKKELTITYETLYELLRREKSRDDIQELDLNFIASVKQYLEDKRSMLHKDAGQQMLFSEEEQKKTLQQISNIIKLIRELYDRREKKIISVAINMSKTNSKTISTGNLLPEERLMFDSLVNVLNFNRAKMLCMMIDESKAKEILSRMNGNIIKGLQECTISKQSEVPPKSTAEKNADIKKEPDVPDNPIADESETSIAPDRLPDATVKVKFREPVPKFIDPKLKSHGPFEIGQIADLPAVIADALLKKGKANTI